VATGEDNYSSLWQWAEYDQMLYLRFSCCPLAGAVDWTVLPLSFSNQFNCHFRASEVLLMVTSHDSCKQRCTNYRDFTLACTPSLTYEGSAVPMCKMGLIWRTGAVLAGCPLRRLQWLIWVTAGLKMSSWRKISKIQHLHH